VYNDSHATDWDNVKVTDGESDKTGRLIREAVWIRKSKEIKMMGAPTATSVGQVTY